MSDAERDVREIVPGMAYAGCPLPGVATAGQPSAEELERLAGAGYRVILDLRAPGEPRSFDEPQTARDLGLDYHSLPVTPMGLSDSIFDRFLELMREPANRPILVHCASANRVGALLLPYFVLDQGKNEQEALELALEVGLRSQELADKALDYTRRHQTRET